MNRGPPVFTFTPHEAESLMQAVGRNDMAASAFVADCEDCLHAFDYVAGRAATMTTPDPLARQLRAVVESAAELRQALYELPEELKMLIDMHLLSDGARRRLAQDVSGIVEPLEDLAGGISDVEKQMSRAGNGERGALEDRLVLALAGVFRNRLNRKASAENSSGFPGVLSSMLDFASRRLPSVSACRGAITQVRLRRLFARSS